VPDPSATPSAPAAPTATEIVHAPDRGTLAAGRWEAPPWAFYVGGAVALAAALAYLVFRLRGSKVRSKK
jgi:hypothetical protein